MSNNLDGELTDVSDVDSSKLSLRTPMDRLVWEYQRKEFNIAWRWNWLQSQSQDLRLQLEQLESFRSKFEDKLKQTHIPNQDYLKQTEFMGAKKKPKASPFLDVVNLSDEEQTQHPLFSLPDNSKMKRFIDDRKNNALAELRKKRGRKPKARPRLTICTDMTQLEPSNVRQQGKKQKLNKSESKETKADPSLVNPEEASSNPTTSPKPLRVNSSNGIEEYVPEPSPFPPLKQPSRKLVPVSSAHEEEVLQSDDDGLREDDFEEYYEDSGSDSDKLFRRKSVWNSVSGVCCRCSCCKDGDSIQTRRQSIASDSLATPTMRCRCTHFCRCLKKTSKATSKKNGTPSHRNRKYLRSRDFDVNNIVVTDPTALHLSKIPPKQKQSIWTPTWRELDSEEENIPTAEKILPSNSVKDSKLVEMEVNQAEEEKKVLQNCSKEGDIQLEEGKPEEPKLEEVKPEELRPDESKPDPISEDEDTSDEYYATRHIFRELLERKRNIVPAQTNEIKRPENLESLPSEFFVVGEALERKKKGKILSKREREKLENLERLREKFKQKLQKMKERYLNSPKFHERNWEVTHLNLSSSQSNLASSGASGVPTLPDVKSPTPSRGRQKKKQRRRPLFILSSSSDSSDLEFEDVQPQSNGGLLSNSDHLGMNINEKLEVKIEDETPTKKKNKPPPKKVIQRPHIIKATLPRNVIRTPLVHPPPEPWPSSAHPLSEEDEEEIDAFLDSLTKKASSSEKNGWEVVLKPVSVNPNTKQPRNVIVLKKKPLTAEQLEAINKAMQSEDDSSSASEKDPSSPPAAQQSMELANSHTQEQLI